jgi:hypothetical protein
VIRSALVLLALLLAGITGLRLYRDLAYVVAADRSGPALLAGDAGAAPPAGMLIILQPEDCLRSGELVARWNAFHRGRRFPVTALIVGSDRDLRRQRELLRQRNLTLPLRAITQREAGIVAEKLGYTSTPFAVMIDRAGRVAGSFPASQNLPADIVEDVILNPAKQM